MSKSFVKFVNAWKELADSGATEINEATLTFFLTKNFGVSRNSFNHYKEISLKLGFITANKLGSYSVNVKAVEMAFHSKEA